jgi:hypothetical protein
VKFTLGISVPKAIAAALASAVRHFFFLEEQNPNLSLYYQDRKILTCRLAWPCH